MSHSLISHAKKLGYPAALREPIVRSQQFGLGASADERQKRQAAYIRRVSIDKLVLLFEHYNIDKAPDMYLRLIKKLVEDWVPGFAVVDTAPLRRGRPKENVLGKAVQIFLEVDTIRMRDKTLRTKKAACKQFFDEHQNDPRWKGKSYRSLENIYDLGKKTLERRKRISKQWGGLAGLGQIAREEGSVPRLKKSP